MKITEIAKNLLIDKTCRTCHYNHFKNCFVKERKSKNNTCKEWVPVFNKFRARRQWLRK